MENPTFTEFKKTKSHYIDDITTHETDYADMYPEGTGGWLYWDGRLFIQYCEIHRCVVDLFGGEFEGKQSDCEAELWHACINEGVFTDSFSKEFVQCRNNTSPCERRRKSSDNTCDHYPQ